MVEFSSSQPTLMILRPTLMIPSITSHSQAYAYDPEVPYVQDLKEMAIMLIILPSRSRAPPSRSQQSRDDSEQSLMVKFISNGHIFQCS